MPFILSLASLVTLILYTVNFDFRFYSHFLLGQLVHGVSGGKILFFLLYVSACFLMLHFKRTIRPGPLAGKAPVAAICFVAVGALSSLASYIHYVVKYSLPVAVYTFHFRDIYNSVNYFPHIHTSKLYLYTIARLAGVERYFAGFDDGRVFAGALPICYPLFTAIAVLALIMLSFCLIPRIVNRWDKEYRTGIMIITVLSSHAVIKCLSDGGPFAYDFLVSIGALSLMMNAGSPEEARLFVRSRRRPFFWTVFLTLSLLVCLDPYLGILVYTLEHGSAFAVILLLIYTVTIRKRFEKKLVAAVLILALSSFTFYNVSSAFFVCSKPFLSLPVPGTTAHYFHYRDGNLPAVLEKGTPVFTSDLVQVYAIPVNREERLLELYRRYAENPYRNRHITISGPHPEKIYGMLAEIRILAFRDSNNVLPHTDLFRLNLRAKEMDRMTFYGELIFNPAFFAPLSAAEKRPATLLDENNKFAMYYFFNRFLERYAVREFLFIPFGFYAVPQKF